jgi:hypothetical protein
MAVLGYNGGLPWLIRLRRNIFCQQLHPIQVAPRGSKGNTQPENPFRARIKLLTWTITLLKLMITQIIS